MGSLLDQVQILLASFLAACEDYCVAGDIRVPAVHQQERSGSVITRRLIVGIIERKSDFNHVGKTQTVLNLTWWNQ